MFFAVKHIYLTLYIVYIHRIAPTYSVPARSHACSLRSLSLCPCGRAARSARCGRRTSGPIASSRSLSVWPCGRARCAVHLLAYVLAALASVLYRLGNCYIFNDTSPGLFFTCARCACLCVRLLMPGQRWTFLSVVPVRPALLARVCARCACPRVCSLCSPACVRVGLLAPLAYSRACSHACLRTCARARMRGLLAPVVRAYIVASPAVLPRAGLAVNFFEIVFKPSISIPPSSAGVGDTS